MKNMARHLNMKQSLLLCTLLAGFACTALAPLTPAAFATEKDAIKVSYHIPAHLSSEEKKWYRTFQEGNMLADGWVDISKDILSRTPAAEQPEQQKNLFQLGDKIIALEQSVALLVNLELLEAQIGDAGGHILQLIRGR